MRLTSVLGDSKVGDKTFLDGLSKVLLLILLVNLLLDLLLPELLKKSAWIFDYAYILFEGRT